MEWRGRYNVLEYKGFVRLRGTPLINFEMARLQQKRGLIPF